MGYCAWCDASVSSPRGLLEPLCDYDAVHGINMQVAPFTPPSVADTAGKGGGSSICTLFVTRKGVEVLGDSTTKGRPGILGRRYLAEWAGSAGRIEGVELDS